MICVVDTKQEMMTSLQLPEWLDDLIFNQMQAKYCPSYSDMTNIDDDREKTLNYLGTYFPRSYAESYCIFTDYFKANGSTFADKDELSIFDFGSGTGGEIIGLLTVLNEQYPKLKRVKIVALDGNQHALKIYDKILNELSKRLNIKVINYDAVLKIDDFYDLSILNSVVKTSYDIIISFKAICEFVTKQQFEQQNPYEYIADFMLQKLKLGGIMLIEDVTTYSNTSQEWLPVMMNRGLSAAKCCILEQNIGYNQTYFITHTHKHCDKSKVAWRMIKGKTI